MSFGTRSVLARQPEAGVGPSDLDLNPTGLRITKRLSSIRHGFELACPEVVAGLRLFNALFRDRDEAVGKSQLLLGMLSIEERSLPFIIARDLRVPGARVELGRMGIGSMGHGNRPTSVPQGHREVEAQTIHRKYPLVDARKPRLADDREHGRSPLAVHLGLPMRCVALTFESLDLPPSV